MARKDPGNNHPEKTKNYIPKCVPCHSGKDWDRSRILWISFLEELGEGGAGCTVVQGGGVHCSLPGPITHEDAKTQEDRFKTAQFLFVLLGPKS